MGVVLATVIAALACNLLAVVLKTLNLGLFGNSLTGALAGALAGSLAPIAGFGLWAGVIGGSVLGLVSMSVIGTILNRRAR